jgi:GTP pyrophosphokinase
MTADLMSEYVTRYQNVLVPAAAELQRMLETHVHGLPRIDRVSVRAKSPDRFMRKAQKTEKDGSPKYKDPLGEIQDQIGARVIVFYTDDVDPVSKRVLKYFRHIEEAKIEPESEVEFGYFGRHYILAFPPDVVPSGVPLASAPSVFELQVRTLFQHAWSEAEHDLGYKPDKPLSADQKRRFAFTAAQAWGADHIFQVLYYELKGGAGSKSTSAAKKL